jgi:hypothetical protein
MKAADKLPIISGILFAEYYATYDRRDFRRFRRAQI